MLRRLGNVFWGGVHENAALVETVTLIGGDEENVKESKLGEIRKSMGPGQLVGMGGGGGREAPWDPFGKPVLGSKKPSGGESKPL